MGWRQVHQYWQNNEGIITGELHTKYQNTLIAQFFKDAKIFFISSESSGTEHHGFAIN